MYAGNTVRILEFNNILFLPIVAYQRMMGGGDPRGSCSSERTARGVVYIIKVHAKTKKFVILNSTINIDRGEFSMD